MAQTPFTIPEGSGDVILGYIRRKSAEWTAAQMIQRVQEGVAQLEAAANAVPMARLTVVPVGEEWSPLFCIKHVAEINMGTLNRCAAVAATGALPEAPPPPVPVDRAGILATHAEVAANAFAAIAAAPEAGHAAVTWTHPLLGELNWREWLLTVRVHCLAHAGQLAGMTAKA